MLNENHALIFDFPEFKQDIVYLNYKDEAFQTLSKQYHVLDYDIRQLEVAGSPTDDEHMHQLKVQRANLKDVLFQQLKAHHDKAVATS
ncbi:YdcH family protein [Shewanella sp. SR44-3]|uniref:YdcH family protein n=1 Tax=Shewanella sp. SR44-3 TaxID=2760936 RepID=UPI0015FD3FC6|nr:YdcH family protein [Shewanella sp. SR44-3]MBB1269668.1 YdcH family protein [Shewanella sp. SR44-3]